MRKVPRVRIQECTGRVFLVPTQEALKNFKKYLNKKEWKFYKELSHVEQLQLALSCDPFNAFTIRYGKIK